jgi:hypothetical protein
MWEDREHQKTAASAVIVKIGKIKKTVREDRGRPLRPQHRRSIEERNAYTQRLRSHRRSQIAAEERRSEVTQHRVKTVAHRRVSKDVKTAETGIAAVVARKDAKTAANRAASQKTAVDAAASTSGDGADARDNAVNASTEDRVSDIVKTAVDQKTVKRREDRACEDVDAQASQLTAVNAAKT